MNDTQTFLDRSRWASGPWDDEPDREQWTDEATGLDCLIRRGPMGNLCGYVAVGADHPWFEVSYGQCTEDSCAADDEEFAWHYQCTPDGRTQVHGGITYADHCDDDPEQGICHLTEDGDTAWWFGFDCAHGMDVVPSMVDSGMGFERGTYKDWCYVRAEVESLAAQLAEVR